MANDSSSQPQFFHCPNCGASLPIPEAASVECEYCGSNVFLPPDYLPPKTVQILEPPPGHPTTVIRIEPQDDSPTGTSGRSAVRTILLVVSLFFVIGIGITVLVVAGVFMTTSKVIRSVEVGTTQAVKTPVELLLAIPTLALALDPATATTPPFANLALRFGGEGSGPGQFLDPRRIAADPDMNIFIADFNSGRIQKFDSAGTFLQMWMVEPGSNQTSFISDMAVDYNGRLYVARSGDILVFEGKKQKPSAVFEGDFPETYYNALAVDPANNLYSLADSLSGEDMIKLNQDGQEVLRIIDFIYAVDHNTPPQNDVIAADVLGNTYFVSVFNPQVFKYDSFGQYADRFGSPGREPGQLDHPSMLAIDGQGRIYILDSGSIQIFDKNGSFLQAIPWDYSLGSPRDLALDIQGGLYIVTSQKLALKDDLSW